MSKYGPGKRAAPPKEKSDLELAWIGASSNAVNSPITKFLMWIIAIPTMAIYLLSLGLFHHWVEDGKKKKKK